MPPEHTSIMLEVSAVFGPMFLIIFGGIIAIYTRLTKIETRMEPMWEDWIKRRDAA